MVLSLGTWAPAHSNGPEAITGGGRGTLARPAGYSPVEGRDPNGQEATSLRTMCGDTMRLLLECSAVPRTAAAAERQTALRRGLAAAVRKPALMKVPVVVNVVFRNDEQDVSLTQIGASSLLNRGLRPKEQGPGRKVPSLEGARRGLPGSASSWRRSRARRRGTRPSRPTTRSSTRKAGGIFSLRAGDAPHLWVCRSPTACWLRAVPGPRRRTRRDRLPRLRTPGAPGGPVRLGRTATHEVAHTSTCATSGPDHRVTARAHFVPTPRTPPAPTTGRPPFPAVSCGNGPHGDMFMNNMDTDSRGLVFISS